MREAETNTLAGALMLIIRSTELQDLNQIAQSVLRNTVGDDAPH